MIFIIEINAVVTLIRELLEIYKKACLSHKIKKLFLSGKIQLLVLRFTIHVFILVGK